MRILVFICLFVACFAVTGIYAQDKEVTNQFSADLKSLLWQEKVIADTTKIMLSEVCRIKRLSLKCWRTPVKSFDGLECFSGLEELEVQGSTYPSGDGPVLDLSANTALKRFVCPGLYLSRLNLRQCKELEEFVCGSLSLDTLDVSQNLQLKKLSYGQYPVGLQRADSLSCLVLPTEPCQLQELSCWNVLIKEMEVKNCPRLKTLNFVSENLSSLRINGCAQLDTLRCPMGLLEVLNVENCPELKYLDCSHNRIRELDLSRNTRLTAVLANKQESRFLISEGGRSGKLQRLVLPRCRVAGEGIRFLDCKDNALEELDISGCEGLQHLVCSWNNLKELNTSRNPELIELDCGYNFIGALDLSSNTKLQKIHCGNQGYKWIRGLEDDCRLLKKLILPVQRRNQKGSRLEELDYGSTELETLIRFGRYPELSYLDCSDCGLTELKLRRNRELRELICSGNPIESLSLSANRKLTTLSVRFMPLRKLDLKRNTQLRRLLCRAQGKNELLLILSKYVDPENIDFDTETYEKELLWQKKSESITLPPPYMKIRQK